MRLKGDWQEVIEIEGVSYSCGFCNKFVGPSYGYECKELSPPFGEYAILAICPNCNKPTYLNSQTLDQVPSKMYGNNVEYLPQDIEQLYSEARNCISVNAYNSAVLACRKLLMNISHSKGAKEGESFLYYVNFLSDYHYVPTGSRDWVDHIRQKGNQATHEIPSMTREDAIELLDFTEMLLRSVYEMPGKMARYIK